MSYEIVYNIIAAKTTKSVLISQAKAFLEEKFNASHLTEQSNDETFQLMVKHYNIGRYDFENIVTLFMETGSSNVYECDSNRRSRSWSFLGCDRPRNLLMEYGIGWAGGFEDGCLRLHGKRFTKAESWIRRFRKELNDASIADFSPRNMKFSISVNDENLEKFRNSVIGLEVNEEEITLYGSKTIEFSLHPRNEFEQWLFSCLVQKSFNRTQLKQSIPFFDWDVENLAK